MDLERGEAEGGEAGTIEQKKGKEKQDAVSPTAFDVGTGKRGQKSVHTCTVRCRESAHGAKILCARQIRNPQLPMPMKHKQTGRGERREQGYIPMCHLNIVSRKRTAMSCLTPGRMVSGTGLLLAMALFTTDTTVSAHFLRRQTEMGTNRVWGV